MLHRNDARTRQSDPLDTGVRRYDELAASRGE